MAAPPEKLHRDLFWAMRIPDTGLASAGEAAGAAGAAEGAGGAGGAVEGAGGGGAAEAAGAAGAAEAAEAAEATEAGFEEVRRGLDAAKQALEEIAPAELGGLMQDLDLYRGLRPRLEREFGLRNVTNATLKLLELLAEGGLLGPPGAPVRAFCNAELPGAFVECLGHVMATARPGAGFAWVASSLYPGGGAELGDHFGVYARNRDRWLMGPEPNALPPGSPPVDGDLTNPGVVVALAAGARARLGGGATLYTSDAGTDVSADPNRAEELTAWLHLGQVACGLLSLAPGGALVAKTYTFCRGFSRALIALLAGLFESLEVTKPLASRPANSEVYLVGRGFRGLPPGLGRRLLGALGGRAPGALPPPLAEPAAFVAADRVLLRAARQVHGRAQVAFLREAVALAGRRAAARRLAGRLAGGLQARWLARAAPLPAP